MHPAKPSLIILFAATSLLCSSCVRKVEDSFDPWALQRCVLNLLPPAYYTVNEQTKIPGTMLGPSELDKFIKDTSPDLAEAIKEETRRMWPTETAYRKAIASRLEDSTIDFAFNLARNLSRHFKLNSCGKREQIEMIMVSILSDKTAAIFRGNSAFTSTRSAPTGPSYLVMMAAGATMNGYTGALDSISSGPGT